MNRKNEYLNFERICRICCSEGSMMSVFKMSFHKKIMTCTGIQVWQNDGLPKQICKKCVAKLHVSFQFKKMCEVSDLRLREFKEKYIDNSESDDEIDIVKEKMEEKCKVEVKTVLPIEFSTLTVPQEYAYQDCIPLTDARHYDTPQNISLTGGDIHYDTHLMFNGTSTMISAMTPVNLSSQVQISLAGNYNLQNIANNSLYQNNYNIQGLSQTQMINSSQVLSMDNLADDEQPDLHTTSQSYLPTAETVSSTPEESKEASSTSSLGKVDKRRALKLFYKKCEEENRCPICNKAFNASTKLTRHMKIHGEKMFKCKVCKKGFSHMGNFRVHMRIHNDERPFICQVCRKPCRQQQDLDKHMRTHTGEKPHKCQMCQKAFATSSNLIVHERTHTGEKPYVCSVCQKAFCQSNELSKHLRTHTGEKSHICPMCDKGFNGSSMLVVHMRTHTGERPYVCNICNRGFTQSTGLTLHSRVHLSNTDDETQGFRKIVLSRNPKSLRCSTSGCSRKFSRQQDLLRHSKVHETPKIFKQEPF